MRVVGLAKRVVVDATRLVVVATRVEIGTLTTHYNSMRVVGVATRVEIGTLTTHYNSMRVVGVATRVEVVEAVTRTAVSRYTRNASVSTVTLFARELRGGPPALARAPSEQPPVDPEGNSGGAYRDELCLGCV
jgi:hypothetical protein